MHAEQSTLLAKPSLSLLPVFLLIQLTGQMFYWFMSHCIYIYLGLNLLCFKISQLFFPENLLNPPIILKIIPTKIALLTKNSCNLNLLISHIKSYTSTNTPVNTLTKWEKLSTAKYFLSCSHGYKNYLILGLSLYKYACWLGRQNNLVLKLAVHTPNWYHAVI